MSPNYVYVISWDMRKSRSCCREASFTVPNNGSVTICTFNIADHAPGRDQKHLAWLQVTRAIFPNIPDNHFIATPATICNFPVVGSRPIGADAKQISSIPLVGNTTHTRVLWQDQPFCWLASLVSATSNQLITHPQPV